MTTITQDNAHTILCTVHESCDGTERDCRTASGMRPGFDAIAKEGEEDGAKAVADAVNETAREIAAAEREGNAEQEVLGWSQTGWKQSARNAGAHQMAAALRQFASDDEDAADAYYEAYDRGARRAQIELADGPIADEQLAPSDGDLSCGIPTPDTQRRMHAVCCSLGHTWASRVAARPAPGPAFLKSDLRLMIQALNEEGGIGFRMEHVSGTGSIHLLADGDGLQIDIRRPGAVLTALRQTVHAFGYEYDRGSAAEQVRDAEEERTQQTLAASAHQIAEATPVEPTPLCEIHDALQVLRAQLKVLEAQGGVPVCGAVIAPDGTVTLGPWHQMDRQGMDAAELRHWRELRNLLRAAGSDLPSEIPTAVVEAMANADRYAEAVKAAERGEREAPAFFDGKTVSDWQWWSEGPRAKVEFAPRRRGGFRAPTAPATMPLVEDTTAAAGE